MFGDPRETWVFSKLQGVQYYFLENFSRKWTFYESEKSSDSSLHHIFEFENFKFPFLKKNSLTWGLKCEKWICEYRELIRKASKIVHEWNGHLQILIRPQPRENFKAIFVSPNRYFTQNSRWVLLYALQTERGRFFMTLLERTCMNSNDMGLLIVSSSGSSGLRGEFPWQNLTDIFYILKLFWV